MFGFTNNMMMVMMCMAMAMCMLLHPLNRLLNS